MPLNMGLKSEEVNLANDLEACGKNKQKHTDLVFHERMIVELEPSSNDHQ